MGSNNSIASTIDEPIRDVADPQVTVDQSNLPPGIGVALDPNSEAGQRVIDMVHETQEQDVRRRELIIEDLQANIGRTHAERRLAAGTLSNVYSRTESIKALADAALKLPDRLDEAGYLAAHVIGVSMFMVALVLGLALDIAVLLWKW